MHNMFLLDTIKAYLFLFIIIIIALYVSGVDFPYKSDIDKYIQDFKTKYMPNVDATNTLNSIQKQFEDLKNQITPNTPNKNS